MTKLVIHVPHASTTIPDDVWAEFTFARHDVEAEAFASADLYTNEIARQAWPNAQIIEAEVSRIVSGSLDCMPGHGWPGACQVLRKEGAEPEPQSLIRWVRRRSAMCPQPCPAGRRGLC